MSRATATILFTDLVGSTELRGWLGEEAADELRRIHDQLLAQPVEANNGRVVKGLGDGIMAAFAGASDAVVAAVAIQQAIDRLNRSGKAPVPLEVRIGLSAGDVSFEDDDVHGTPVIEASRLCGAAVGGEILASEVVRWLGGAQGASSFIPVGSLELKGLTTPVPALRIEWEPDQGSTIPVPALLTDVGRIFVGRDAELERLTQLWKEAAAGERRVALLAGEPGVGKTRLAAQIVQRVHEQGGAVLAGRCDEDLGVPYQPFVEALRHFADHTSPEDLRTRLGRYGGELARLVPELTERVPDLPAPLQSDPETERYRLFDAVAAWLASLTAEHPVLVVLDDLHWAAKPTLLLLRHVLRSAESLRLLVVVTYRDTDVGRAHPLRDLLADLRRAGGVERFSLGGLDRAGVGAFIEAAAGHDLADEEGVAFVRAVFEETEGNPFFVGEVIRHLSETGRVERRDRRWVATVPVEELGIPEGVRDVVGRRLSRLSEAANRALAVAAAVGLEFEAALVRAAGDFEEDVLLSALDEAVGARLVSEVSGPVPRYRFGHALVRATLYDELSAARRGVLHRKAGEAIEVVHAGSLDDYLPALAHHWAQAAAPAAETAKAVEYATRAGDRALAQLAHDEAVAYFRSALELLSVSQDAAHGATRLQLLISLGEAERRAGEPAYREHLLDAVRLAQKRSDPKSLARATLANCRGTFSRAGAVDADRVACIELALAAIGDQYDHLKARLLAHLAMELHWGADVDRRRALCDEAIALARDLNDPAVLTFVLTTKAAAIWDLSTVAERLDLSAEAVKIAEATGDPQATFWAGFRRWGPLLEVGALDEADRLQVDMEQLADNLGQSFVRSLVAFVRANRFLMVGGLDDAEQASREGLSLGEQGGQPDASTFFTVQLFVIRYEQGRMDDDLGAQLAAFAERVPLPISQLMLAVHHCERGRSDDAASLFADVVARGLRNMPRDNTWSPTMALAVTVCASLKDTGQAAALYEILAPFEDLNLAHTLMWFGTVAHYLGILDVTLGRFDDADVRFAAAATTHERLGTPCSLARTRLEWGRMLLTRRQTGDPERARELLGQALATARELGMATVERRAVELLA
jgi:class 3 adenylate cyclase/tetratricopeptide (TPR) repeat protein